VHLADDAVRLNFSGATRNRDDTLTNLAAVETPATAPWPTPQMCLVQPALTCLEKTPVPQPRTMKHADAVPTAGPGFVLGTPASREFKDFVNVQRARS
jgi:hypothetical protein